jgi:hypothetical protein
VVILHRGYWLGLEFSIACHHTILFGAGEAGWFPNLTKAFCTWVPANERTRAVTAALVAWQGQEVYRAIDPGEVEQLLLQSINSPRIPWARRIRPNQRGADGWRTFKQASFLPLLRR